MPQKNRKNIHKTRTKQNMPQKKSHENVLAGMIVLITLILFAGNSSESTVKNSPITSPVFPPEKSIEKIENIKKYEKIISPILMYHYIRDYKNKKDPIGIGLSIAPEVFEQQLQIIQDEGFRAITLNDLKMAWAGKKSLPEKKIILTFDDGYEDFYTAAFPLLKKYNMRATVYMIANKIDKPGYLSSQQLKELDWSGLVTIASHGLNHVNFYTLPREKLEGEMQESKKILENLLEHKIKHFAYPVGAYDKRIKTEAEKAGYATATLTDYGYIHEEKNRLALARVRVQGGISSEKFKSLLILGLVE